MKSERFTEQTSARLRAIAMELIQGADPIHHFDAIQLSGDIVLLLDDIQELRAQLALSLKAPGLTLAPNLPRLVTVDRRRLA